MSIHREYRKLWVKAEYESTMGSAWVVPPPPKHQRRVYHLTSAEYALDNIRRGRLKVSRFSDSNDPFELLSLTFDDGESRRILRNFKKEYDRTTGLLCFSENWVNSVLWSHYGARHHGICLGFNALKTDTLTVKYADARIRNFVQKIMDKHDINDAMQELLICTKFRHWEYEKEVRIKIPLNKAFPEQQNYYWPFNPNLELAEVILGPLCPRSLDEVRAIVTSLYPSAVTIQARLAINSFSIVPKESTIP
jgi:hypothetical protein